MGPWPQYISGREANVYVCAKSTEPTTLQAGDPNCNNNLKNVLDKKVECVE